jgi:hypothetical protein
MHPYHITYSLAETQRDGLPHTLPLQNNGKGYVGNDNSRVSLGEYHLYLAVGSAFSSQVPRE